MRKFLLILLICIWGVLFTTPLTVNASTTNVINNYFDLPNNTSGSVIIEAKDGKNRYNLTFIDSHGNKYLLKDKGLPEPYNHNKTYEITYKVLTEDDEKFIYLEFEHSSFDNFIWRVNDGFYKHHNIVTVTSSYIDHYDGFLNSSPARSYYIHFNVDVPMDIIYRIDVTYFTRKKGFKEKDWERYDTTLYYEELETSSDFKNWIIKYRLGINDMKTITKSRLSNYQWQALIWLDPGHQVVNPIPLYVYPNREFRDFRLIKFYYVYDGRYYESTEVKDDGTDYSFSEWENIIDDFKKISDNFQTIFNKFSENKEVIFNIGFILIVLFLAGVTISILSFVIKPISLVLSIIFKIIISPFTLLSRLFNRT